MPMYMYVPELIYGLRLFIVVLKNYIVYHVVYMLISSVITSPSFVRLYVSLSEIVLPEGVYCCFTRTTLFTTMFTMIILVYLLKCLCIPSFIFIDFCVS